MEADLRGVGGGAGAGSTRKRRLPFIRVVMAPKGSAMSPTDAQERANALKANLRERNVHSDVLVFCRGGLLQKNYFHASSR